MRQNLTRFASISFLAALVVQSALAQVPASQDTIYIPGGTLRGRENAGLMEATINGDTTSTGARINPNRVELYPKNWTGCLGGKNGYFST